VDKTAAVVAVTDVFAPSSMVGFVENIVVPFLWTSHVSVLPVGAVVTPIKISLHVPAFCAWNVPRATVVDPVSAVVSSDTA